MPPKISILIAVRNEEKVILRCLRTLEQLTYPTASLQILIGNDASTDNTYQVVSDFIAGKPSFELHHITETVGKQVGKGNVLAQLAQRATGDFLFITDADVAVSKDWIEATLAYFDKPEVGVVSNFTWIESHNIFEACQSLEWTQALFTFSTLATYKIPLTAQGNNMAMRQEAYRATGGYEALQFSVTEDFALFWEILAKGYDFRNTMHQKGMVTTLPAQTWHEVFKQRRRWMVGAFGLGLGWQMILWTRIFAFPILFALFFFVPMVSVGMAGFMCVNSYFTLFFALKRVGKLRYLSYFPFFIFYQEIMLLGSAFYYARHKRVKWKGREF